MGGFGTPKYIYSVSFSAPLGHLGYFTGVPYIMCVRVCARTHKL